MFLLALASLVVLIVALREVLITPEAAWQAASLNQWMWLGVLIFLPLIGIVLYLGVARSRLQDASRQSSVAVTR